MISKLKKKEFLKLVVFIITLIVVTSIISDWEHFKEGVFSGLD